MTLVQKLIKHYLCMLTVLLEYIYVLSENECSIRVYRSLVVKHYIPIILAFSYLLCPKLYWHI